MNTFLFVMALLLTIVFTIMGTGFYLMVKEMETKAEEN